MSVGSGSVPIGMRRPSAAREALRFSPLVKARWADGSGIECVPLIPALAKPLVLFPGRPTAERTADARGFGLAGFLLFKFSIQHERFRGVSHKTEYSSRG